MDKKIILHYDMDAFFASIEERENIYLKDKPFVVGNSIITTANYISRKYGIKSAMPVKLAKQKCSSLIVINPRMSLYVFVAKEIQKYINKKFSKVDFISIDEGFIDITDMFNEYNEDKLFSFINNFKLDIYNKFKLTCSVGIGYSKLTAKIASDVNKPNGFYFFKDINEFNKFIKYKPLSIIPGIGKKTIEILNQLSIITVNDLLFYDEKKLYNIFNYSKVQEIYDRARGTYVNKRHNKDNSISMETTFYYPENDIDILLKELEILSEKVIIKLLSQKKYMPRTISIKIKDENYITMTRSKTFAYGIKTKEEIFNISKLLFNNLKIKESIRLIGINISHFENLIIQNTLF